MVLPQPLTTLTGVVADILYVVVALFGASMLVWYQKHKDEVLTWLKLHISPTALSLLSVLAHDAVLWVEANVTGTGATQFAAAVRRVQAILQAAGLNINVLTVEQAVQAAWSLLKANGTIDTLKAARSKKAAS